MELMSSLLLCALAAALPQALGKAANFRQSEIIILINPNATAHKQILLNMNAPPLVNSVSEMQSLFKDPMCRHCLNCMERAIKAHLRQSHYNMLHHDPDLDELYYEVLNENHPMDKRGTNQTKSEVKSKPRAIKTNKNISITKYSDVDGKVYALKVKESSAKNDTDGKKYTCKVYAVNQSLGCDTFSFDGAIEAPKKKVKRDRKSKHKTTSKATVSTTTTKATTYKKREHYNSEVSESFMPSLEDMY